MNISKKRCERDATVGEFFLSLVDYRNNLFTSNNPDDIMKFYESFQTRDDLIGWMQERPKGAAYIREVEGTKDIVVVIPTADFNGKYAKECRENIFKGLHIIFVESGEVSDPYFNYAHNCNVGIRKAMEYNPEWVVVSNDDMYKIDDVEILRSELAMVSPNKIDVLFNSDPKSCRRWTQLSIPNLLWKFAVKLSFRKTPSLVNKLMVRFNSKLVWSHYGSPFHRIGYKFQDIGPFGIFSSEFLSKRKNQLYDEAYINGVEDMDLSIYVKETASIAYINYNISSYDKEHPFGGATIGTGSCRKLRDVANQIYLNYKTEKGWLDLNKDLTVSRFI